jgi:hypothetical protein
LSRPEEGASTNQATISLALPYLYSNGILQFGREGQTLLPNSRFGNALEFMNLVMSASQLGILDTTNLKLENQVSTMGSHPI